MSSITMRLTGIPRLKGEAPHQVFARRDGLQMRRIHAASIAAQVIQLQAARNLSDEYPIGDAVGEKVATAKAELTVSRRACRGCPLPTSFRLADLCPEALKRFRSHSANVILLMSYQRAKPAVRWTFACLPCSFGAVAEVVGIEGGVVSGVVPPRIIRR